MTRVLRASTLLLPILWLTGCDEINFGDGGNWDRYKEDFHYSYALPSGGHLSIENLNGSVDIIGWEKETIDITGTKHGNSEQAVKDTRIDITPSANSVTIRTVPPTMGYRQGGVGARYVIRVPKKVELDRVVSSNGSVRLEDLQGASHVKTSNGAVRTTKTNGELEVRTSNGSIEVQHAGSANLHSSNGAIRGDVEKGAFEAGTSNGSITVRLTDTDANQPVRAESSNGHIELTLNAAREVRASTSNSSITLRMPPSTNARLRAHTSNSSINTDFDVTTRGGTISKHTLEGQIGSGGPLLDLSTTNGGIKIVKY